MFACAPGQKNTQEEEALNPKSPQRPGARRGYYDVKQQVHECARYIGMEKRKKSCQRAMNEKCRLKNRGRSSRERENCMGIWFSSIPVASLQRATEKSDW
jgi:hypothetical protein